MDYGKTPILRDVSMEVQPGEIIGVVGESGSGNNDAMAVGAVTALQNAGYNHGDPAKTIPVFGIDATDVARALIRDGLMTGTVRQDTKEMAQAVGTVAKELLLGRSPANAMAAAAKLDPLFSVENGHTNKLQVSYTSYP